VLGLDSLVAEVEESLGETQTPIDQKGTSQPSLYITI
jgi:hypothetical protein